MQLPFAPCEAEGLSSRTDPEGRAHGAIGILIRRKWVADVFSKKMASNRTQSIKTHDWLQADVVSLLCERERPGKRAAWHDREAESDGCARWRLVRRRMRQRENHTSYHKSLKHKQRQYERIRKERNREDGAPVYRQRAHSTPRHSRRAELRWLLKHTRQRNGCKRV